MCKALLFFFAQVEKKKVTIFCSFFFVPIDFCIYVNFSNEWHGERKKTIIIIIEKDKLTERTKRTKKNNFWLECEWEIYAPPMRLSHGNRIAHICCGRTHKKNPWISMARRFFHSTIRVYRREKVDDSTPRIVEFTAARTDDPGEKK